MTLKLTRMEFIEFSGRYDLVVDTDEFVDQGADKFIRAGQRWLDRRFTTMNAYARHHFTLAPGLWYALVPDLRAAHEVWMSQSDTGRWQLEKKLFSEIRTGLAIASTGRANCWSLALLRTVPEPTGYVTVDDFSGHAYTIPSDTHLLSIVWSPPVSVLCTLEVFGHFYSPPLLNDEDVSYWTEHEQHSLVMAACRALEQSYRNTQGMMDWENAIVSELLGLELDLADQESIGVDSMEGKL